MAGTLFPNGRTSTAQAPKVYGSRLRRWQPHQERRPRATGGGQRSFAVDGSGAESLLYKKPITAMISGKKAAHELGEHILVTYQRLRLGMPPK